VDGGVSAAFDEWVEARAAALLRFAYLVTGSQHEAEEAVQAALTRALEKWSRVRRTTDPDQYVRRMIVNEHISGWRRGRRRELPVAQVHEATNADPADAVAGSDVVWRVCSGLPAKNAPSSSQHP
jgi:DNA-directed RNA polymerase specialized sigma24 family protein